MAKYAFVVLVLLAAGFFLFRRRGPEQRLKELEKEGTVFQTQLQGKPVAFLVSNCSVYLLDASGRKVKRTKVLKPDFYLGFTTCLGQSIRADGEFVLVTLENRALGAGGGNTSGGFYRSRDGVTWEKKLGEQWDVIQ
jgi:hypothetical protein